LQNKNTLSATVAIKSGKTLGSDGF